MTSTNAKPTAKVAAGGAAGFIAALIMWAISASGVAVPEPVILGVPWLAGVLAAYLKPDRLVEYGRLVRDARASAAHGRHADNGDGIPDNLDVLTGTDATSDTKRDAAL